MPWTSKIEPEDEEPAVEGELTFEELPKFMQEDILHLRARCANDPKLRQLPVWK